MNPLADASLETRHDIQRAVIRLIDPLVPHFSPGAARVKPGPQGAHFPDVAAEMEGFARPLWGLAPHAAGGGDASDHWERYRRGLVNGTDPQHPEYWGPAGDTSQKHVETAAIGFALALAPGELWDPISEAERERVATYLNQVNDVELYECNWLFFRVVSNVGLRAVGAPHDWAQTQETLDRLESYYLSDGWYADGPEGERPCDYYIPWAMHAYGLLYATLAGEADPERAERFRERAAKFATHHRHWFAPDGAGIPYGRSLTYRFAQAAFWGALAFADVEALPWAEIKGLWLRNLRWWADQPDIALPDGVLSVGYRYPTLKVSENYNSPSSPYWAMKAFLPLALDADHPFWTTKPAPLDVEARVVQPHPKAVLCYDAGHRYSITAGQDSHYLEKYTKFTYSSAFGFGVCSRTRGLPGVGLDGTLAVSEGGRDYRTRLDLSETTVEDGVPRSVWRPYDDVSVESWVAPVPSGPWHVRVHRLDTGRSIHVAEGGFAAPRVGDDDANAYERFARAGVAHVEYPEGTGGIRDLGGERAGHVVDQDPNTNVLYPRTAVPALVGEYDPGTHWLVTAVTAATSDYDDEWDHPPEAVSRDPVAVVMDGEIVLRCGGERA